MLIVLQVLTRADLKFIVSVDLKRFIANKFTFYLKTLLIFTRSCTLLCYGKS